MAAILSLTIHFLIQFGQIELIDVSGSIKRLTKNIDENEVKPIGHVANIGIASAQKRTRY